MTHVERRAGRRLARRGSGRGARRPFAVAAALLLALSPLSPLAARPAAAADPEPTVELSPKEGGAGGDVTVKGRGWQPGTLLTVLMCGQNAIGGTSACANATGKAATTGDGGGFSVKLPIAEPPEPCPCVVHVTTVTGPERVVVDAPFTVAGHPVAALPETDGTSARLTALKVDLEGSGNLLTWFGAPPQRTLVVTVGNMGSAPAKDPTFRVGSAHSVFAPEWQDVRWKGTVPPGGRKELRFPVELAMGAHGDYSVSLEYGGRLLTEKPWSVPRPWGVTLFWVLLCVVVPAAVFRIGLAVVNRVSPALAGRRPPHRSGTGRRRRRGRGPARPATQAPPLNGAEPPAANPSIPWFSPGTLPAPLLPEHDEPERGGTP